LPRANTNREQTLHGGETMWALNGQNKQFPLVFEAF